MRIASLILAAGITAASTAAFADTTTSRIVDWNPAKKLLTLSDKTQMDVDPSLMPADAAVGSTVTITYEASESGVEKIIAIVVKK